MSAQSTRALMHHTLGNGEYNLFQRMTEPVVCAQAIMHPQNVAFETERLIAEALYHRRPVYMAFPADPREPIGGEHGAAGAGPPERPRVSGGRDQRSGRDARKGKLGPASCPASWWRALASRPPCKR